MIEPGAFEALTFDCYGTLVDWERGIVEALRPLLAAHGVEEEDERLLERFGRLEAEGEAGAWRPYRRVLEDVARGIGRELAFGVEDGEAESFAASVADWPPFPDTVAALKRLAGAYRLAIVSNVDDDLFAGSARKLGVHFEEVVTAQQIRSYKPAPAHFVEVLDRLDLPRRRVLHVAQSLYHDVGPATDMGIPCAWVNRRAGKEGPGATAPASATPDFEVPDMESLARLLAP